MEYWRDISLVKISTDRKCTNLFPEVFWNLVLKVLNKYLWENSITERYMNLFPWGSFTNVFTSNWCNNSFPKEFRVEYRKDIRTRFFEDLLQKFYHKSIIYLKVIGKSFHRQRIDSSVFWKVLEFEILTLWS